MGQFSELRERTKYGEGQERLGFLNLGRLYNSVYINWQVQNDLAELGLVGVLNDMFDKLDWTVTQPRVNTRGIHGYGCACNPKSVRVTTFSYFQCCNSNKVVSLMIFCVPLRWVKVRCNLV